MHKIKTPVFLACQFNDEQTGAHCPNLADRFTGTKRKWFTFTNGLHINSLDPETFNRWFDFLELYVAQRRPELSPLAAATASVVYATAMGVPGVTLPPDPIRDQPTFETAKAAFESQQRVRVLFDSGAGGPPEPSRPRLRAVLQEPADPGHQAALLVPRRRAARCSARPRRRAAATPSSGTRSRGPPTTSPAPTPAAATSGPRTPASTGSSRPRARPRPTSRAPLGADTTIIGAGALRAWIRASVPDVDLQVTVSEVRPDGKETYVQSGWLRASMRKLDKQPQHPARARS